MKNAIWIVAAACLLAGAFAPAKAEDLKGTLKKVKETGTFTIGHRDGSIPLSYLDDKFQPVGFSIELCKHVVEAVKAKLGMSSLKVAYNPVTSVRSAAFLGACTRRETRHSRGLRPRTRRERGAIAAEYWPASIAPRRASSASLDCCRSSVPSYRDGITTENKAYREQTRYG